MTISNFPKESKIWIYQSDRKFNSTEYDYLNDILKQFVAGWNNHGTELSSGFEIKFNQFIILAVDEAKIGASGCSIDSSVRIIKEIARELNIDFFDRMKVAVLQNDEVVIEKYSDWQSKLASSEYSKETKVFNNLITDLGQLENEWIVNADTTWLKRSF